MVRRGKMSLCFEDYIRKFMVMEIKIDDSEERLKKRNRPW
jgi:hypothetical protein